MIFSYPPPSLCLPIYNSPSIDGSLEAKFSFLLVGPTEKCVSLALADWFLFAFEEFENLSKKKLKLVSAPHRCISWSICAVSFNNNRATTAAHCCCCCCCMVCLLILGIGGVGWWRCLQFLIIIERLAWINCPCTDFTYIG